ncbi:fatty-acid--CoA ligase [Mycobacterium sp. pW045]|uniref:fatty-acid--CoA ligase n=1 Tax=Mycobacterium sp. pW045 TaxID=3238984 RepID=UPI00351B628E
MTENVPLSRSLVLVTDYRVPDPARVWPLLRRHRDSLAHLGASHVLVYTSSVDPGRVLALMSIRAAQPVTDLLRDEAFMAWFDAVGVDDIPAVFAGSLVERIELADSARLAEPLGSGGGPGFASPPPARGPTPASLAEPPGSCGGPGFASPPPARGPTPASLAEPPGVVVAAVAEVVDAEALIDHVHDTAGAFAAAGIRKVLIFQAFDNPREVFMLQEAAEEVGEAGAGQWISQPEFAAEWVTRAGVGVYPPVFVGRLAHLMRVADQQEDQEDRAEGEPIR